MTLFKFSSLSPSYFFILLRTFFSLPSSPPSLPPSLRRQYQLDSVPQFPRGSIHKSTASRVSSTAILRLQRLPRCSSSDNLFFSSFAPHPTSTEKKSSALPWLCIACRPLLTTHIWVFLKGLGCQSLALLLLSALASHCSDTGHNFWGPRQSSFPALSCSSRAL